MRLARFFRKPSAAMLAGFLLCIFLPAAAHAQGGVLQYGPVNTGHPAMWFGNGAIGDGGSPQGGPVGALGLTGVGVTNPNTQAICTTSGPITAAYAQLCLGFNNGVPQITLGGYPSPTSLQFLINGTIYTIPSSLCTGCGSMAGQNANNVSISGGNISGVTLSGSTLTGNTFLNPTIIGFATFSNKVSLTPINCGTSPSGNGSSQSGFLVTGTGTVNSCQVNLPVAPPTGTHCVATEETGGGTLSYVTSPSSGSTLLTFTFIISSPSTEVNYFCS